MDAKVSGWLIARPIVFMVGHLIDRSLIHELPMLRGFAAAAAAAAAADAVVVALLRGQFSSNANVAEQGFRAIGNLAATNDDNNRLLGAAGACKGE